MVEVLRRAIMKRLQDIVAEKRLSDHLRLSNDRHAKKAFKWSPLDGRRKVKDQLGLEYRRGRSCL